MIGSAKITYDNENVCELVRKDLVDKFGNRELANYNLYLPGVIKTKAVVTELPNPDVKVTSVEDQIKEMGVYPKKPVIRNPESVYVAAGLFGSVVSSTFDHKALKLIVAGGPVSWTSAQDSGQSEAAHWYGINIDFPLDFEFVQDDVIPYTLNGEPHAHVVTSEEETNKSILILADAKFTTMNINIHWDDNYGAELIKVLCNASLESKAIDKIPAFPTEPKFEFTYLENYVVDSNVEVDVDLDSGIK